MCSVSLFLIFSLKDKEVQYDLVANIHTVNKSAKICANRLGTFFKDYKSTNYKSTNYKSTVTPFLFHICIIKTEVPDYRVCPAPIKSSSCIRRSSSYECLTNDDCLSGTRCCSVECCPGSCRKECVNPVLPG